jgi:two-component system response regulator protein BraR/BceR
MTMDNMKIFVVEDDAVIASAVKRSVEAWGCGCRVAQDFRAVLQEFAAYDPQLVLMDITLPFYNGYHWCSEIRKLSKVPVMFLSSASDNMNIVMAMNMGGDDFIAKPFDLSVLTAKVQAMLRRTYEFAGQSSLLERGGAILSANDSSLSFAGICLELSKNEYRILQVLMQAGGAIVPRETLMQRLWESDSFVDENTLSVNVARLRKKLEGIGLTDFIVTKKGVGYQVR